MAIEGFDAGLPIEIAGFLPQVGAAEAARADAEPTLDAALRRAERAAMRAEIAAPDLWIGDVASFVPSKAVATDPVPDVSIDGVAEVDSVPNGAEADVLITRKLMPQEIGHPIGGRQYDSTDYGWQEMSSGDYEWALRNFMDDVYAAIAQITSGTSSPQEAAALAQLYLMSVGLGDIVHVNNPPPNTSSGAMGGPPPGGEDAPILVMATNFIPPHTNMPTLWMHYDDMEFLDPGSTFVDLDASAHTVDIDMQTPLTQSQQAAIQTLRESIAAATALLNSLPSNGVFTFSDGRTITVADLRALWALADFVVTDRTFNNGIPSMPGAGASHWNNGNPLFEVNIIYLTTSFMTSVWQAMWYIFHELAHVTPLGVMINTSITSDGNPTDTEFRMNEAFATATAFAIWEAAEHQWPSVFLDAHASEFEIFPRPTFSVPGGSSGSGGGTGGGGGGGGGGVSEE